MAFALTPSSSELHLEHLEVDPSRIAIVAAAKRRAARCPSCGQGSIRVHSRYERRLADLP